MKAKRLTIRQVASCAFYGALLYTLGYALGDVADVFPAKSTAMYGVYFAGVTGGGLFGGCAVVLLQRRKHSHLRPSGGAVAARRRSETAPSPRT